MTSEVFEVSKLLLPTAMTALSIIISGNPTWSEEQRRAKLEESYQAAKVLQMI